MSWLNTTKKIWKPEEFTLPCVMYDARHCPYGQLVEEYPLTNSEYSCPIFGHDCPGFYLMEYVGDKP